GATVPGMPFTILGHNARIAWGMTSTHSDIQDLFVEQIEADGKQYRTPDGMKPFESESQTIAVKGAEPVKITVRRSRHGPIVSDVVDAIGKVAGKEAAIALAATFLEPKDTTVEALYKLNRALGGVRSRAPGLAGAAEQLPVRRRRRQHRLRGAGPGAGAQERLGPGTEPGLGRRNRLERLPAVRPAA
ncbi:MAG: penicillin acylase family protein, partial [Rhodospirillales bacterium]|nr:penicillin acylase family protein [Rhodospirillales bacterium]